MDVDLVCDSKEKETGGLGAPQKDQRDGVGGGADVHCRAVRLVVGDAAEAGGHRLPPEKLRGPHPRRQEDLAVAVGGKEEAQVKPGDDTDGGGGDAEISAAAWVGIDPAVQAGEDATGVGDPTKIAQLARFGWIIF